MQSAPFSVLAQLIQLNLYALQPPL